ncbi:MULTISPECIES: cold-shock protein [unclassified Streptomyces]|uniref:cold-shock protein n=1 Tax=unclassified Streptomyces TaxID=2593676 RepID=UPI000F6B7EFA|nr:MULTISPECIES: cold shock domain-containing protein [unclassified Streptomyces]AZM64897.1 DNA-binding protein [Streptomyces sp. WAC 01438]RSM94764.1 DNA-binding protein [Streptomyces sp. WAC 01420]
MAVGRVIRFDGVRGYGFIAPEHGGEDVFLHANDLLVPESSLRSGTWVKFEVEQGDRGPKASHVELAEGPATAMAPPHVGRPAMTPPLQAPASGFQSGEEPTCDVLSVPEYTTEVTELMLSAVPSLTGEQITRLRQRLVELGKSHGWVDG